MGRLAHQRVLHAPAAGDGQGGGLQPRHAVVRSRPRGPGPGPRWSWRSRLRLVPQPVRPGTEVHHLLRGRGALDHPPPRRRRDRHRPGAVRRLHARGALHGLQGCPAQAEFAGGHRRRAVDRRGVRHGHRRRRGLPCRPRAQRAGGTDRRAGGQGDRSAAAVPRRRGAGLPHPVPLRRHPVGRRGAADPAGHPDRGRAGRRAVRPR
ncbi:hypothetical protein SDC9_93949 [bioreactor metagenome]|uniref:Uncharacterized protein n=1 Tax=bioreactor metagenome TaxID=1076179 RepID=A0A645A4R4_9ZZZZ